MLSRISHWKSIHWKQGISSAGRALARRIHRRLKKQGLERFLSPQNRVTTHIGTTRSTSYHSMEIDTSVVVALAVLLVVISKIGKIVKNAVWDPYMTCRHFWKQGVPYIPYSPLVGSVPEIGRITADVRSKPLPFPAAHQADHVASYVLPHYHHWKNIHGNPLTPSNFIIALFNIIKHSHSLLVNI